MYKITALLSSRKSIVWNNAVSLCVLKKAFPKHNLPLPFHTSSVNPKDGKVIRIGCASGFWGDTPTASGQLINHGEVDFIIYDYLSEITMSLLTAAQSKHPERGFAPDFVMDAVGPYLKEIKNKGIRIISNAGGINPSSCANALQQISKKSGVDLKIATVSGDNILPNKKEFIGVPDMKSAKQLPEDVHSMNVYLGCAPIVECLNLGADIVITGRCADSSLALAPMIHSFGWKWTDYDLLASGSLAGHLIECGAQVTGGIFTDWEDVHDWDQIGFPIAEVSERGIIKITKPPHTGGLISKGTVAEQMLYEIEDPRSYILPDVVCDFTQVSMKEVDGGVVVSGTRGKPPTNSFKVCATYLDGYKATAVCCVGGPKTTQKAKKVAEAILKRCRRLFAAMGLQQDFARTHVQVLGSEDTYGSHASISKDGAGPRDAVLWMSVHHAKKKALDIFAKEVASAGTGMAPGLTAIVGGRPKPSPLLKLHSFLIHKEKVVPMVKLGDMEYPCPTDMEGSVHSSIYHELDQPTSFMPNNLLRGNKSYPLSQLAYTRSGDKGNSCNIGVIARKESYLPYIQEALSTNAVAEYFSHLFPEGTNPIECVKRYEVGGIHALNFVLENCLGGGGVASLRSDPQGKALAQMLLDFSVSNMPSIEHL